MVRMDVRQQPEPYGEGTGQTPEKLLGEHDFDGPPVPGQELDLNGEVWVLTEVHDDWVYVTPTPPG